MGRAARTLTAAIDLQADWLIFNTAASTTADGVLESEATRRFALTHLADVYTPDTPEYATCQQLLEAAYVDTESIDTLTKAEIAVREAVKRSYDVLIFVSDETHSPRMLRDLIIAKGDTNLEVGVLVADGSFGPPSFIAETPINSTDPYLALPRELQLPTLLGRIYTLPRSLDQTFLTEFDQLLKKFGV